MMIIQCTVSDMFLLKSHFLKCDWPVVSKSPPKKMSIMLRISRGFSVHHQLCPAIGLMLPVNCLVLLGMCLVLACQIHENHLPSSTKHLTSNGQANSWHLLDNCLVMLIKWFSSTYQASTNHAFDRQYQEDGNRLTGLMVYDLLFQFYFGKMRLDVSAAIMLGSQEAHWPLLWKLSIFCCAFILFEKGFLNILYTSCIPKLYQTFVSYNHQLTYLWMCGFGCYLDNVWGEAGFFVINPRYPNWFPAAMVIRFVCKIPYTHWCRRFST